MSRPRAAHSRAPRVPSANSGLPVLDGCAPASNRRKSLLSACSAGRDPVGLVTISGASIADQARPVDVRRQRGHDLLVGAHGAHVQQPGVRVEDRQPGGLPAAPGEVDPDEVHSAKPTSALASAMNQAVGGGHYRVSRFGRSAMGEMIRATGLVKRYKEVVALAGLDLSVPEGKVLALLGPNGAGKTTAVRILTTLLQPDDGQRRPSPGSTCWPTRPACARTSACRGSTPRSTSTSPATRTSRWSAGSTAWARRGPASGPASCSSGST